MNQPEYFKGFVRRDPARSVRLDDVGGGAYHAVMVVGPNNFEYPLLYDTADSAGAVALAVPEHEVGGPLPLHWQDRIWDPSSGGKATHYCGRSNRRGEHCRSRVRAPGEACRWHTDSPR